MGNELGAGRGDVALAGEHRRVFVGVLGHLNFLSAGPPTGIVAGDLEGLVIGTEDGSGVIGRECERRRGDEDCCQEQAVSHAIHESVDSWNPSGLRLIIASVWAFGLQGGRVLTRISSQTDSVGKKVWITGDLEKGTLLHGATVPQ